MAGRPPCGGRDSEWGRPVGHTWLRSVILRDRTMDAGTQGASSVVVLLTVIMFAEY